MTWRQGTKGKLSARFAMIRVRVGDGAVWANNRHLPGAEVWLVGEWRTSGERKYYLANLPPHTTRRALAGTIKARWVCEQAHQQMKEELGLDHFEGRSWTGLHRHALMTCLACAYLQHLRLAEPDQTDRGEKGDRPARTAAFPEPAGRAAGHHRPAVRGPHPARAMPALSAPLPAALRPQSAQVVLARRAQTGRGASRSVTDGEQIWTDRHRPRHETRLKDMVQQVSLDEVAWLLKRADPPGSPNARPVRLVLAAMAWHLQVGGAWRRLPAGFPPGRTF